MATQEITLRFNGDPSLLRAALKEVRSEHASTMTEITKQVKAEAQAAIALQRQRSAALVAQWKIDLREATRLERERLQEERRLAAQMIREARAAETSRIRSERAVVTEAKRAAREREQEERRLAAQMIREARAAEAARIQTERRVAADTRRYARDRERIAEDSARAIAAAAKREADARIREGRRAANAALQTIKPTSSGGGADLAAALGFGGGIAGGITALVGASAISEIRAGARAWLDYSSKLESTRIAFTTMLGSAQRATAHLKELQAFAIKTPFQFEELIDASQRMQALGFQAEQVIPILTDVGNAVAAAGGGSERLDRVVLALSQMQSKGKVATQELNQLAEAGISGFKILELQTGKSRAELVKMVEQGQISSSVFLEAFQKFSQANFGGLMEKQAKTFTGAMSNIKDAALATAATAFAPLFEKITQLALEISRIGTGLSEAASGVSTLTAAIGPLAAQISGLNNIPVPKVLEILGQISGVGGVARLLGLFGSPEIAPLSVPKAPTALPPQEIKAQAEQISALKTASEEAKRIAADRIAEQERLFRLGKITRRQETENIIAELQRRTDAEKAAIEEEIQRKLKEFEANKDNAEKQATIIEQVSALQQQTRNLESEANREAANRRAELQLQERKDLLAHEQAKLEILLGAGQAQRQVIEAHVRAGAKSREQANNEIEAIENKEFESRLELLNKELLLVGKEPAERQRVANAIAKVEQEKTANQQLQSERRKQTQRDEAQHSIDLQLKTVETTLRLGAISDASRIAALRALAAARVKSEEQVARQILAIRLEANQREQDAIRARLTAAGAIRDPKQRAQAEADLNNQLKILQAERTAIEANGARDQDEGRRRDLENQRRYALDVIQIRERIRDIEREAADRAIDVMILNNAGRRDIIRAQVQLDISDENERHRRELASIAVQERENRESNRTEQEKLEQQKELNHLREAEAQRHQTEMDRIKGQARREGVKVGADGSIEDLSLLERLIDSIQVKLKDFTDFINGAFISAFHTMIEAVGEAIAAWALYGDSIGTALRKALAQILAQIAAEAAIQSLLHAAYAIARLAFLDFAGAARHGIAAAKFAAVAAAAGIGARVVAGNAFSAAAGGGAGATGPTQQPQPEERDRTIREGRTGGRREFATSEPQLLGHLAVDLKYPDGYVETKMVQIYDRNGRFRSRLRSDLLSEANG